MYGTIARRWNDAAPTAQSPPEDFYFSFSTVNFHAQHSGSKDCSAPWCHCLDDGPYDESATATRNKGARYAPADTIAVSTPIPQRQCNKWSCAQNSLQPLRWARPCPPESLFALPRSGSIPALTQDSAQPCSCAHEITWSHKEGRQSPGHWLSRCKSCQGRCALRIGVSQLHRGARARDPGSANGASRVCA